MADLELQVPQQVEDRFGDRSSSGVGLAGQEHQVDVAERRHLAAAGAAEPDHGHPLGGGSIEHALGH